jgi:hypothetical protein
VTIGGRRKVKFGDAKEDVVSDENEDDDDDDDEEQEDDNDSEEEDDDASDDNDAEEEEEEGSHYEDGGQESDEGDSSDSDVDAPKLKLKAKKRKIGENFGKPGEKVKKTRVALETVENRLEVPVPPAKKPRSEMSLKELNRDMLREMGDSGRDQSLFYCVVSRFAFLFYSIS